LNYLVVLSFQCCRLTLFLRIIFDMQTMLQLISEFPQQLSAALDICQKTPLHAPKRAPVNVVITGMGGSGIGGSIVADLLADQSPVPILVNKDYHLPAFVGPGTLLIACSYSGNTEETLMAMARGLEAGAEVAIVTSGGTMADRAGAENLNKIVVPGGHPPRSMLGYALVALLHYANHYGLAKIDLETEIPLTARQLENEQDELQTQSGQLAARLKDKTVAIYAATGMGGVATRWRQQLNENAKMPGWDAEVPEMNHNELVGWEGGNGNYAAVFLGSNYDYSRNQRRMEISRDVLIRSTPHVFEVWAKHGSKLAEVMYLIHYGDWLSYYLSELNQVDIMAIQAIGYLKEELAKL
jgi:glucose/mannose-6-phosphate isomerase